MRSSSSTIILGYHISICITLDGLLNKELNKKPKKSKLSGWTLEHLGSEVFCHNKSLPGKGYLGLYRQSDHEKDHIYPTDYYATYGTVFTQTRHQDIAAGREGIV